MKLSLILCLCVCFIIVLFSVECYGKGGRSSGGFRGGGSRRSGGGLSRSSGGSKGSSSGSSGSGGIVGWFKGLFGGSKSSPTSSSSTSSFSSPNNEKIGFEGLYSGKNPYSPVNNNLKPINTDKIGFENINSNINYHKNDFSKFDETNIYKNLYSPTNNNLKPINRGNIGFEGINSNINYHKNDFSKFSEPKVNNNPYSPSFGRYQRKYYGGSTYYPYYYPYYYNHHHPRYHSYNRESTSNSGHINESLLYNPCIYYGGFNNKPIDQTNDKDGLSMIHHDKCNTNSKKMKNTLSGPGFGMGLLGGAATGISLGMLLNIGLNSLGSTPWNHNNEAFNEWLKYKVERKMTENPSILGTMNETSIIDKLLNDTKMCPGEAQLFDASILNTLVPCNATNIKVSALVKTQAEDDDCKSLSISIFQANSTTNKTDSVTINIKQNNLTTSNLPEDLSYDVNIMYCYYASNSFIQSCVPKTIKTNSESTLNVTMSYLENLNMTITQFNTTINNSCADITKCSSFSRNITSTLLNLSVLPKNPMKIMMSQCVLIRYQLNIYVSSAFATNVSNHYLLQSVETETVLSSEDFSNIQMLMHQSSDLLKDTTEININVTHEDNKSKSVSTATPSLTTNTL